MSVSYDFYREHRRHLLQRAMELRQAYPGFTSYKAMQHSLAFLRADRPGNLGRQAVK